MRKNSSVLSMYAQQQEGGGLEVREPSAQSWESRIPYVSDGSRFPPTIVKSTRVECVCG